MITQAALREFIAKHDRFASGEAAELKLAELLLDPLVGFIAVVGASGTGKPSLVSAGALPALAAKGQVEFRGGQKQTVFLDRAQQLMLDVSGFGFAGHGHLTQSDLAFFDRMPATARSKWQGLSSSAAEGWIVPRGAWPLVTVKCHLTSP